MLDIHTNKLLTVQKAQQYSINNINLKYRSMQELPQHVKNSRTRQELYIPIQFSALKVQFLDAPKQFSNDP
jgi:hypothetical protein